jgi:hypothetical protein
MRGSQQLLPKTHIEIWSPFSKLAIAAFAQTVRVQTVPGMGSSLWLLYDCWDCHSKIFGKSNQSRVCFSGSKLHSFSSQCKPTEFCKIKKKLKISIRFVAEKSQTFDIFDLWRVRLFLEHVSRVRLRDWFILHCYWRSCTRPLCLISVQQETCTGLLPLSDANGKKSLFGDFGAAGFEFGLMVDTTNCRFGAFLACNGL